MKRKISVILVAVFAFGMLQFAAPSPASACEDPNCPWSPVTSLVHDMIWWVGRHCDRVLGPVLDPNPCP